MLDIFYHILDELNRFILQVVVSRWWDETSSIADIDLLQDMADIEHKISSLNDRY